MEKYPKPEVGQEVFIVPSDGKDKHETAKVEKVGKKYFYIGYKGKFSIEEWKGVDYSSQKFHVYPTREDYLKSEELKKYNRHLHTFFSEHQRIKDLATAKKVAELIGLQIDR